MPPWLTLSAVKDLVIVVAIVLLGWWVYHSGQNSVHVKDLKAMQAQLAHMQAEQQSWQLQQERANAVKQADLSAIDSGNVVRPVTVRLCVNRPDVQAVLPSTTTATAGNDSKAGGGNLQAGPDIGPAVQAYEKWIERRFADCRLILAQWPSNEVLPAR